jgi:Holliday junction resolvasome RuvABC ATP-dependent DNA helicase subunit
MLKEQKVQLMETFVVTPKALQNKVTNPEDPICPFHGYIGNREAVNLGLSIVKKAFNQKLNVGPAHGEPVWACTRDYPVRILLTGPRSVGKTTFARGLAATASVDWDNCAQRVEPESPHWKLPWIEIDCEAVKRREHILEKIQAAMRAKDMPLTPKRNDGGIRYYQLPPMWVFLDEVQSLSHSLMEGTLKMTEPNDGLFEVGINKLDCRRVTFVAATTHPGDLTDTFKSRFPVRLELKQHTLEQIAEIIRVNGHDWPLKYRMQLAQMKPLPREAIAIARLITDTAEDENIPIDKAFAQVTGNMGLEASGLSQKAITAMQVLADAQPHGLSKGNICVSMAMSKEEFEKEIVPQLLRTPTHPAYITISSRHKITKAGLDELRRRGL